MTKEQSFVSADHIDLDPFISSQTRERALNSAIIRAEISESFEEYLEIFDAFYADDIAASSETGEEPIRGRARVRSILANTTIYATHGHGDHFFGIGALLDRFPNARAVASLGEQQRRGLP